MIRAFLAGALLCLLIVPASAQKLHPRCNIDWPCQVQVIAKLAGHVETRRSSEKVQVRIARLAARGRYLEERMPIGRAIYRSKDTLGFAESITRPARYIAGRLVCAINVNAALAERGIRGTGSALAKSFLHWGQSTAPTPGAVAVYNRKGGGHVAIVSRVEGGRVYVWNPSSRGKGWREVEYRRRAIDYRAAL